MNVARTFRIGSIAALHLVVAGMVQAEEAVVSPALLLELNNAQPSDKGCRLTFVVANNLDAVLTKVAFEIALFDSDGVVDRLAALDFQELPAGKTKVTRFDLSGVDCAKIGRILVNHAVECAGAGVEANTCMRNLQPRTRTSIAFGI